MLTIPQAGMLPIGEAAINAVLGYGVVFFGLLLLMIVISLVGAAFAAKDRKNSAEAAVQEASVPEELPTAPGSAGDIKLHNVDPKTAAMLMAIVADKLGKPLCQLRFISIKEVE